MVLPDGAEMSNVPNRAAIFSKNAVNLLGDASLQNVTEQAVSNRFSNRQKFIENGQSNDLTRIKETFAEEWTLASFIAQSSPDSLNTEKKLSAEELKRLGYDPSRIAALVVLEKAHPGVGLDSDYEQFSLQQTKDQINELKSILKLIPGYQDPEAVNAIMNKLGLKFNTNAGNFSRIVDRSQLDEILRGIAFTNSA